jgi:hypothetical protein
MAPPAGSARIRRPRAATSRAVSGRDSTPATWAAATSPIECPASRSGRTPQDSSSRYSATSMANSAGWVRSVSSSSSPEAMTSANGCSSSGSSWWHTSSKAARKAGNTRYSSRPIPVRWAPCPVNRKPSRPCCTESDTTPAAGAPTASASRPARSSSALPPRTTARCSKAVRVDASDQPMSAAPWPSPDHGNSSNCRAPARSASGERADTTQGRMRSSPLPVGAASRERPLSPLFPAVAAASPDRAPAPPLPVGAFSPGPPHSPTTTWQLVPPIPKELTPAVSGRSGRGHAVSSCCTARRRPSNGIRG